MNDQRKMRMWWHAERILFKQKFWLTSPEFLLTPSSNYVTAEDDVMSDIFFILNNKNPAVSFCNGIISGRTLLGGGSKD